MERRRERRISVKLPGTYRRQGADERTMFFAQLSSKGCRLDAHDMTLDIGDAVELNLGPIGPIAATVRWRSGDAVGVEFAVALDAAIVSYFAAFITDAA